MSYVRIDLAAGTPIGDPASLPAELVGLDNSTLADLPAAIDPVPEAYKSIGYWPADFMIPTFDPLTQAIGNGFDVTVDVQAKRVTAPHRTRDLTPEEIEAAKPDMPSLRVEALATAMAYGNAITAGEINQWAGVEPLSWTQQRDEAIVIRDGGALDDLAVLPGLAEDKGITLAAYAEDVLANAMRYQTVLRAAVYLRRHATSVLADETIDTPAKLADAVAMLQAEADRLAAQLLGG